jgi:hypothetical protein
MNFNRSRRKGSEMEKAAELDTTISEIDSMLNGGGSVESAPVDGPTEGEAAVEAPSPETEPAEDVEKVAETGPTEEEFSGKAPEEPAPAPVAEAAPEAPATPGLSEEGLNRMRKSMMEMAARLKDQGKPGGAPTPTIVPDKVEFVDDKTFDAMFQDRTVLNEVLSKVYQKGLEDALRHMPSAVGVQVTQQVALATAAREFFANNPDLDAYRPYVAHVAARVEAENPDLDYVALFQKIEETARGELMLAKKMKPALASAPSVPSTPRGGDPRPAPVKRGPAMAPGTTGSRNTPRAAPLTGQDREIADLFELESR